MGRIDSKARPHRGEEGTCYYSKTSEPIMAKTLSFDALGKAAKDLLGGGFQLNQKVTATTKTDTGVDFTVSGVKKDEKLDGDYSADIKVAADSKVTTSIAYSKLFPGLKVALNGSIPDKASGKLSFDYSASANYIGAAYAASDYKCALLVADKGDTLKTSYVHSVSASTTVGGEVVRKFAKDTTNFTVGAAHKLENGASTKAKIDNTGIASILYEQEFAPKSKTAVTLQFDTMNLNKSARVGVAMDFKS